MCGASTPDVLVEAARVQTSPVPRASAQVGEISRAAAAELQVAGNGAGERQKGDANKPRAGMDHMSTILRVEVEWTHSPDS